MKKAIAILFILFSFLLGILSDYHKEHPKVNILVLAAFLNFLFGIFLLIKAKNETPS
jgi:hypothetical protein